MLKESKLITYFHTKSPQTLEFSSIFYDQYKSSEFIVNTTLCIENYCILIHCSDISQITKLLFETKSNLINVSDNAQKSSQDVLAMDEAKNFYHNFIETKKISEEANASPLTLNDIVKYKKFRNETYGKFDSDIISLMVFAYRFLHEKNISDVLKKIGVIDMKFNPVFDFISEKGKLIIKVSEESKNNITLDFNTKKVDILSIKSEIGSLTLPEKRCILFLTFSVLSKQACLIKGKTASGKSHIIRLFAKMLGKKLHVYQWY